jgi:NAD(P)-dependent dehydrogenase (short-subunit alcohol dehydrogenase family)
MGATLEDQERELREFREQVAVITGAASGIGRAIAERLAGEGAQLVLADVDEPELCAFVAKLEKRGSEVIGTRVDVTDFSEVQRLADIAWQRFGSVAILFNNAGATSYGTVEELTLEDWEWPIRVNLWGVIHGLRAFLPRLLAADRPAHIVNVASFAGFVPNAKLAAYCASKYAVVGLSECLSRELRGTGIDVSILAPMLVRTSIWETSGRNRPAELGGAGAHRTRTDEERAALRSTIISAEEAAEMLIEGIRERKLYVFTHPESRAFLKRRFDRIDQSFEASSIYTA